MDLSSALRGDVSITLSSLEHAVTKLPGRMRLWKIFLGTIIGLAVLVGGTLFLYSTDLPPARGPFPVGRASYTWTDSSRHEPWVDNPAELRQLLTYVWYPAGSAVGPVAPYFPSLEQLRDQFHWYERFVIRSVRSQVLESADVVPAPQEFPVLLFSPGANNSCLFYSCILADLASHGFVVVGMDHCHEGRGQVLSDGTIILPDSERQRPSPDSPTQAPMKAVLPTARGRARPRRRFPFR